MICILGAFTGAILSANGVKITSWFFWVILGIMLAYYALGYKKGRDSNDKT